MKTTQQMGLKVGDRVEFVTGYPGHEGEVARGEIIDVGSPLYPRWPTAMTQFGQIGLPRTGVTVIG